MSETTEPHRIGLIASAALVVASMIGTGIFTTTGFLAADLGGTSQILLCWLVGGLLALCGALVYGELGAMMPRAGGEYVYLSKAFSPLVGFLSGWVSLFAGFSAPAAASAMAFGSYLHAAETSIPASGAALALVVGLTLMHAISLSFGTRVQTVLTVGKVVLILGFILAAFSVGDGDWSNLEKGRRLAETEWNVFAVSLIWVSFAYSGWNAAAYLAGDMEDPGRNLPLALVLGTLIVVVLYVALNVVFFYATPVTQLAAGKGGGPVVEVGHEAAIVLFGSATGAALSLLIALALASSVSAMILAGPRVYQVMAEDGVFFSLFAKKNKRGVPQFSVIFQGALTSFLIIITGFEQLMYYIGFTLGVFSALTVAAAIVLRRTQPDAYRPFKVPGWPVPAILYICLSLWMAGHTIFARPWEALAGSGTLVIGALVFLWQRHSNREAGRQQSLP